MSHQALIAGILGAVIAQLIKFFTLLIFERRIDVRTLVTTGGMPSSHTALVVGLATSVGLLEGFNSVIFDVSLVLAMVVMYDAAGVRRAAGKQARIINRIIFDLQHSLSFKESHLKELLGHTPLEVVGGAILGILVALGLNAL